MGDLEARYRLYRYSKKKAIDIYGGPKIVQNFGYLVNKGTKVQIRIEFQKANLELP